MSDSESSETSVLNPQCNINHDDDTDHDVELEELPAKKSRKNNRDYLHHSILAPYLLFY